MREINLDGEVTLAAVMYCLHKLHEVLSVKLKFEVCNLAAGL